MWAAAALAAAQMAGGLTTGIMGLRRAKPVPVMNTLLDTGRAGLYGMRELYPAALQLEQAYGPAAGAIGSQMYRTALLGGGPQSYDFSYYDPFAKQWSTQTISTGGQAGALPTYRQALMQLTRANQAALDRSAPGVAAAFEGLLGRPFEVPPDVRRQIMQEALVQNTRGLTDLGPQPSAQALALLTLGREAENRFLRNLGAYQQWAGPGQAAARQMAAGLLGGYMGAATRTTPGWDPFWAMDLGRQQAEYEWKSKVEQNQAYRDFGGGMFGGGGKLLGSALGWGS